MQNIDLATLQKKVRQIEIVSNRIVNERMAGEYHSMFKGQGIEFEEVRPYTIGDDVRSIDWNVTARAGAPHVRRYREERERTVFIVADLSASASFGATGGFKSELMAEICSVLAMSAIANNDRVGLLMATDRVEKLVPPRKGRKHVLRLVREVLGFEPEGTGTDLALALDHLRHVLPRRAIVFLISDFMDEGYERALAVAARRHDLIAIDVEDPIERALPPAGVIEAIDAESGRTIVIDAADPVFRKSYEEEQAGRRSARESICRRHNVDMLSLNTGRPYEGDLVKFFKARIHKRR